MGKSVHNQRIECLWRDVYNAVTQLYYHLFYSLEGEDLLDSFNELHLFSLHYVFYPRINKALEILMDNHKLSTCHHQSPLQLYTKGVLTLNFDGISVLDYTSIIDENIYGAEDGNHHSMLAVATVENDVNVEVPEVTIPPCIRTRIETLPVDSLKDSMNYGIELYTQILHHVMCCLNE